MCGDFRRGLCKRGETCKFSHGEKDLTAPESGRGKDFDSWNSPWNSGSDKALYEGMQEEEAKELLKSRNDAATREGRAIYVRGIPPDWGPNKLEDFMSHQGHVEWVHMMPRKETQPARAAFVNFSLQEDAKSACQVCDRLELQDNGKKYNLECAMKNEFGKAVHAGARGMSLLTEPRQRKKAMYLSGVPSSMSEAEIKGMCRQHGIIADMYVFPPSGRNLACFVTYSLPEEAKAAIEAFDGSVLGGSLLSATHPRPPKRSRAEDAEDFCVEIKGFPPDTMVTDIYALLESSGVDLLTAKMLRHPQDPNLNAAHAWFGSLEDADKILSGLQNFESSPGYHLACRIKPKDEADWSLLGAGGAADGNFSKKGGDGGWGAQGMDADALWMQQVAAAQAMWGGGGGWSQFMGM
eukprot:gnl/TRDRNA2_/TRDRNA2_185056_c0_seq1.p1 gnl/TRDRNA2_/TRDRNA2_185056_c0~~gnl/TRDRNA2_/TRDRNA2_185056_c0_seq1.p1  ORF type:complete len:475 (+),score=98.86 gnl/TRDRNA2_/TRDRNA2_185056_c0_seq1:204-1427(+)